MFLFISYISN